MISKTANEYLEEIVTAHLLRNPFPGLRKIDFSFSHVSASGMEDININQIDTFRVERNFESSYMDYITMSLTLLADDALKVIAAYQDLRCNITLWTCDYPYGYENESFEPLMLQYKVLLENPGDLLKRIESGEFQPPVDTDKEQPEENVQSTRVPISMQLLTDTEYEQRHKPLNTNTAEVKPEDLIYFIANAMGFTECKVVPPDNTREYEQVPIPPMVELNNAFQLIQDRYGVYNKGLSYYVADKKLYIYPKYDNEPQQPLEDGIINIYKLGTGAYTGLDAYVAKVGEDMHCMVNQPVELVDLSEKSVENGGNTSVMSRAETGLDVHRNIQEGKVEQSDLKTISIVADSKNTAVGNTQYAKYITAQDNVYKQMEQMAQDDCVIASIPIRHFDPFTVFPGQPVIYHYEEKDTYKTAKGMVMSVAGQIIYEDQPSEYIYSWISILIVRLTPEKKESSSNEAV